MNQPNYMYPNYPYYPPTYQPPFQPTVRRKAEFIQGRVAADAYQVNAGEEVFLIDMDNPLVYRKARGFDNVIEPMEIYDLTKHEEHTEVAPQIDFSSFVTADQMEKRINEEVDRRLSELSFKPSTPKNKRKVEIVEDEE